VCDGADNDCNDLVDEDAIPLTYYRDDDGDDFGIDDDTIDTCGAPDGYVGAGGDCADDDDGIFPGAEELCDYIDSDCDGEENPACFVPDLFDFSNCGATQYAGPTQEQCDEEYLGTALDGSLTVTGGIQEWVAPVDGEYTITAVGARGASGDTGFLGGLGVEITGTFIFTEGTVLYIAVGQQGSGQSSGSNGGGGGGTWVVQEGDIPLVIAGGGGGTRQSVSMNGCGATASEYGTTGSGGSMTWSCGDRSGMIGTGGAVSSGSWGSGGGGFDTDGGSDYGATNGGSSWFNGLNGGYSVGGCSDTAAGGFGGGGSGQGCNGGGGGGGYSGGEGGRVGGGGGSHNAGSAPFSLAEVGDDHGYVTIEAPGGELLGSPP
jgi:hypothetical protein